MVPCHDGGLALGLQGGGVHLAAGDLVGELLHLLQGIVLAHGDLRELLPGLRQILFQHPDLGLQGHCPVVVELAALSDGGQLLFVGGHGVADGVAQYFVLPLFAVQAQHRVLGLPQLILGGVQFKGHLGRLAAGPVQGLLLCG